MLTLALAASGVALLGRLSTRGKAKVTWTGYLVFGTGYLSICVGPWCDEHVMPNLLTTTFIEERYAKIEYAPRYAGEHVWIQNGTSHDYTTGEVFGDVNAQTVTFQVAHAGEPTYRYSAFQIRPISPSTHRRLWHSALSVWLGVLGMGLARYLFVNRQDRAVRGQGIAPAPPA
jgi:hypothetical protein